MAKDFSDLIEIKPGSPGYTFTCHLITKAGDKNPVRHGGACMAGLPRTIQSNKSKTVLRYEWNKSAIISRWRGSVKLRKIFGQSFGLEDIEQTLLKFYHLCRDHKMLPSGFVIPKKSRKFYIRNIGSLPPSLLYAYISHMRNVWEEPHFLYNVVKMVEDYGLNPWSAYVIASHISIYNSGHHVLPISDGGYGLNTRVSLSVMFNIRDYFSNPKEKDPRMLHKERDTPYWNVHSHIGRGEISDFRARDLLSNVPKLNDALGLNKNKGLALMKEVKIDTTVQGTLKEHLASMGIGVRPDFYEPWWIMISVSKAKGEDFSKILKPQTEAYVLKRGSYGSYQLYLKVKEKFLTDDEARRKKQFSEGKRESRYDCMEGVVYHE